MKQTKKITDLINLDVLQQIQDNFSQATGLAFISADYKGIPITKASNFKEFCQIARERPELYEKCYQCDAHGGLHSAITGEPYIYTCHVGMLDFAVPFIVDGSYMGAIMGGQTKLPEGEHADIEPIIPRYTKWDSDPVLVEAHNRIEPMPYSKIVATVSLLRDMVQALLDKGVRELADEELDNKKFVLIEERAHRIELEERLSDNTRMASLSAERSDFLFNTLNILAKLAYKENAAQTENVVCDFSDMMRYIISGSSSRVVTLGEELDYVTRYLNIQKVRLAERLSWEITIADKYRNIVCPYMLLEPFIENAIKHAIEPRKKGGVIVVSCAEDKKDLVISISDDGEGFDAETAQALLGNDGFLSDSDKKSDVYIINRKLKGMFGKKYGLEIKSSRVDIGGTQILIRLPLDRVSS